MPTNQQKLVSIITAQLCLHWRRIRYCLQSEKSRLNNYHSIMPTSEKGYDNVCNQQKLVSIITAQLCLHEEGYHIVCNQQKLV